jgi:hypothetical protein
MSRSSELVPWLCARLEDLVTRIQLAAPAAIVYVETRSQGDELTAFASGIATPDSDSLDLRFKLVPLGDRVQFSADLVVGGSGEVLARLDPIVGLGFATPALREQILAFIKAQEPYMIERLHAEARGSEHEAELIVRLRGQAEHARARGEYDEARHAYRMLTMLCCDEDDLALLARTEAEALHQHLARLAARFPDRSEVLARFGVIETSPRAT